MTNKEEDEEKEFWKKEDRDNIIYQSNRALMFGGLLFISFSYQFVKLCLKFSSFDEFKFTVRTTEKAKSLSCLCVIAISVVIIIVGIKIRKRNS